MRGNADFDPVQAYRLVTRTIEVILRLCKLDTPRKLALPVLTLFALDMGEQNSYTPEAPQGGFTVVSSLKTEALNVAYIQWSYGQD